MENKTYNAAVFVIPNGAGYCNEFLLDSYKERYKDIAPIFVNRKALSLIRKKISLFRYGLRLSTMRILIMHFLKTMILDLII